MALIPLGQAPLWHNFKFTSIPANQVSHQGNQMRISVRQSASPLLHRFDAPTQVTGFKIKAKVSGQLPDLKADIQGRPQTDDFILRFGLIVKGRSKLNWFQRQFAPGWLVKMEKLLPNSYGIKEVMFFTTCQHQIIYQQLREHALDPSLKETCVKLIKETGSFEIDHQLEKPLEVVGLWIGADGDQTKAEFDLNLEKVEINYK